MSLFDHLVRLAVKGLNSHQLLSWRKEASLEQSQQKIWMKIKKIQKQLPEVFYKKVFLKISQNSQENTGVGVFF